MRRATTRGGVTFGASEIHLGVTTAIRPLAPFATLDDGTPEGALDGRVIGTYLHGAFEDARVCAELFRTAIAPGDTRAAEHLALADWFERDAERIEEWLV